MPQPVMPVLGPTPVPFEQRIMMDKMTIHSAVTLPQRIQRTPMPGDPPEQQPGAPTGQPQPGGGGMPGAPTQPPAAAPQPGMPSPGMMPGGIMPGSSQFGLPPTDPQGMLQELQSRYSQQPQQQPQPTG